MYSDLKWIDLEHIEIYRARKRFFFLKQLFQNLKLQFRFRWKLLQNPTLKFISVTKVIKSTKKIFLQKIL